MPKSQAKFWIVVAAPSSGRPNVINKDPGRVYHTLKEAQAKAKEIAAAPAQRVMLVLEVVDAYGPTTPPIKKIPVK